MNINSQSQIQTVFSIDPKTGSPYIAIEVATKLIKYHIYHHAKNVLRHRLHTMDDLVQEVLLRLCSAPFDPSKSAAKTFLILVARSRLANLSKYQKTKDKFKEVSDFQVSTDEGNFMVTQFLGVEEVNPEDVFLANELLNRSLAEESNIPKCKRKKRKKNNQTKVWIGK